MGNAIDDTLCNIGQGQKINLEPAYAAYVPWGTVLTKGSNYIM